MRRVKNKTDWKNKIQFQLKKINFDEVSLKGYVTPDTNKSAIRYNPHPKSQDGSEPPLKNVLKLCLMVDD